jgi:hypothetical protein
VVVRFVMELSLIEASIQTAGIRLMVLVLGGRGSSVLGCWAMEPLEVKLQTKNDPSQAPR